MGSVRIAAAHTLDLRDDVEQAIVRIVEYSAEASRLGARLICFPEAFLQGYLRDEGAARRSALDLSSPAGRALLQRLPRSGPMMVIGLIEVDEGRLFNSAIVVANGQLIGRYRKVHLLPSEGIFDAGTGAPIFDLDGLHFGINICYDTNFSEAARRVSEQGGSLIVCPSNNMMQVSRAEHFRDLHNAVRGDRCRETGLWLVSADVTGEQAGYAALGPTAVLGPDGEVKAQLPLGRPGLLVFDLPLEGRHP